MDELQKRLLEISARLEALSNQESLEDSEIEEMDSLSEEAESLEKKISAKTRAENIVAKANKGTGRQVAPSKTASQKEGNVVINQNVKESSFGFASAGEYYKSVAKASMSGNTQVDERLTKFHNAAVESAGQDGGFLIPPDFRQEIQQKVTGDESLLARTRQFKTSSNTITMPTNESAPWDGTGVQALWEGEAKQYNASKPVFGETQIKLHKLTAIIPVSEELLQDAAALQSFLSANAPEAMLHKVNSAILNGTGVGMPFGYMRSGFTYKVAAESGQAADTVIFENIVNMQAHILPASFAKSVWIVNPSVMPQLRLMAFKSGASSPVPAYLPPAGLSEAPYGTLMGRPILPMLGATSALGDNGDIALVDLSYYYSVLKTDGIQESMSTHLYFDKDLVAFKYTFRMGGLVPYKTPVSSEKGAFMMSAFVTLADR